MFGSWKNVQYNNEKFIEILEDLGDFHAIKSDERVFSYTSRVLKLHRKDGAMNDALTRSGLMDYLSEFFPASYDSELGKFELKFDSMNYQGYPEFLQKIIGNKWIIPDTNVLINRTFSCKIPNLENIIKQVRIARISILELETLYQKKNGQPKSRSGFYEVRLLSGLGAQLLQPLPWDLIIEYSRMIRVNKKSDRLGGDPGIRKEILENALIQRNIASPISVDISEKRIENNPPPNMILITHDLVFALATFGEDISCLYLQNKDYTERGVDYSQLATLIHEYANCIENLILKSDKYKIEIRGFWPEKTFFDLLMGRIQYRQLS
jgi:hypothetical protein